MPDETPRDFIQISAVAVGPRAIIYALDAFGRVWKLIDGDDKWFLMPLKRLEK